MGAGFRGLLSAPPAGADLRLPDALRSALLALFGLGCGLSPAFYGFNDLDVWGPLGIGLIAIAIALLVARPTLPRGLAAVAVGALLAFAVWCLLSMFWAESADRAWVEGDRWIVYGVYLLVLVLLVGDRRDATVLLGAAAAGIVAIAGYDLVRLLSSSGNELFSGTRLGEPLGYVNGLGGFFLLGFWPLLAVAERVRIPALAGAAAGGATLLAGLVVLTDSRGTAFALVASALVALALVPGRHRRAWVLVAVLVGLAIAWGPLTDVTRELPNPTATPPVDTIQRAAEWILLAGAGVACAWGLCVWLAGRLLERGEAMRERLATASAALLALGVGIALVVAVASVNDPVGKVSDQYNAFTELQPTSGSRFTSGGGNRYDYWRIAWHQFTDHPLDGVGAGNFDRTYYLERSTTEDVRQAHSIELQTLGETGLVGAVLLGSFLVAVFAGAWRWARAARRDPAEIGIVSAAVGCFVVWLAQTSVDWLHLIPGLAGIALGAAAVLLRPRDLATGWRSFPPLALIGVVVLAVVAIGAIGRPALAERFRDEARGELASDPTAALSRAEESLSLNPDSVQGHILEAAALAARDEFGAARSALLEAIDLEPHNYVGWALLGDLLTRRGDLDAALRAYRHAATLNPRERSLRLLSTDRALLRRLSREPEHVGRLLPASP